MAGLDDTTRAEVSRTISNRGHQGRRVVNCVKNMADVRRAEHRPVGQGRLAHLRRQGPVALGTMRRLRDGTLPAEDGSISPDVAGVYKRRRAGLLVSLDRDVPASITSIQWRVAKRCKWGRREGAANRPDPVSALISPFVSSLTASRPAPTPRPPRAPEGQLGAKNPTWRHVDIALVMPKHTAPVVGKQRRALASYQSDVRWRNV